MVPLHFTRRVQLQPDDACVPAKLVYVARFGLNSFFVTVPATAGYQVVCFLYSLLDTAGPFLRMCKIVLPVLKNIGCQQ